jgi:hypothetical protein
LRAAAVSCAIPTTQSIIFHVLAMDEIDRETPLSEEIFLNKLLRLSVVIPEAANGSARSAAR